MSQQMVILHLNTCGVVAEAWLNGIPVTRVEPNGYLNDVRPVHEYLLPGENRVVLLVQPGLNPSEPMATGAPFTPPPGGFATLQIKQGPRGVFPDDPQVRTLASVEWRPVDATPIAPPVMLKTSLIISHSWPRWSWLDGSNLTLSGEVTDRVHTLLKLIIEGMQQGDPSRYLRAAETRFTELAHAYGLPETETRGNFMEQYTRLSAEPGFRIADLNRDKMALRLCAGGKVIDCLDTSFEPLVRAVPREDGTTPVRYNMKLAMFGQQMRVIR